MRSDIIDLHIRPHIGHVPLADLGVARLRDWQDRIAARTTPGQVNKAAAVLSAALGSAVKADELPSNPVSKLDRLLEPEPMTRALTVIEVEDVRTELRAPRDRALVALLAYGGLRVEEALALRWMDVTPHSISVERAFTSGSFKTTKTKVSKRVVGVVAPLSEDVEAFREDEGGPTGGRLMFGDRSGAKPVSLHNWRARVWHPAREAAEVAYAVPQDLRHTYASLRLHHDGDLAEIRDEMGHTSWNTTLNHYTQVMRRARHEPTKVPMVEAIRNARAKAERRWRDRQMRRVRDA